MEVKTLDLFKTPSFEANGKKYKVTNSVSISRWREYEKLEPRLTFGMGFSDMYKQITKAYNALNTKQGNIADCAVILHNILNGLKSIEDEKREHPALMMAALVINFEGEDTGVYDEQIQLQKIEDWKKEGFDVLPFFTFALFSIQGFRETYQKSLIEKAEEMEKEIEKKS